MTVQFLCVRCASCGRAMGHLDREVGWVWTGAPARLVNRRRFIMTISGGDEPPAAPPDDFRIRTVQRDRFEDPEYTLWEYPYTCDSDACLAALGADWKPVSTDPDPPFTRMPSGRVLS